jgi:hypothetical protein
MNTIHPIESRNIAGCTVHQYLRRADTCRFMCPRGRDAGYDRHHASINLLQCYFCGRLRTVPPRTDAFCFSPCLSVFMKQYKKTSVQQQQREAKLQHRRLLDTLMRYRLHFSITSSEHDMTCRCSKVLHYPQSRC